MNRLLLTATILTFFSPGIYAQNYNPKFDKAPDLAEFRKTITEAPAFQVSVPYPPIVLETVKTISLKEEALPNLRKEFVKAGPGYFYGPYPPRIYNSGPYRNGQPYIPLLQAHESPEAYKLIAKWNDSINRTRGELLDEANTLDPKDKALYTEAVQIDQNVAALNQERENLNVEIDRFNQTCVGVPYPPYYCPSWSVELDRKIADWKRRVAIHNTNVERWRTLKRAFDGMVSAFINKVISWEDKINIFISDAKSVLKMHGTCTHTQWEPLYTAVKTACDVPGGRSCDKGQDCPTLQKNLAQNRACLDARIKIKNECYANIPDQGHDDQITDALASINYCLKIMDAMDPPCAKSGNAVSIPARRYGGY